MEAKHSVLFNLTPTKWIMWLAFGLTHHQLTAVIFLFFCWHGQKKWISGGTVKDERERQSAKINRWIKTIADVSLFTTPLLCFHLLLQVFLHLTLPESLKMKKECWQTVSGQFQHLYLHLIQEKKKNLQPLAAAPAPSQTLCLPHSVRVLLNGWLNL